MTEKLGTVRIAPQVLVTIARLTTLNVPGVVRMSRDLPPQVNRFLHGKKGDGSVRVQIIDDAVSVDLFVIADSSTNLYDLGREIQAQVSRAIKEMVGMPVLAVNVHVEDVETVPSGE